MRRTERRTSEMLVYGKAILTDQYLAYFFGHTLQQNPNVLRTLYHRAEQLVFSTNDKKEDGNDINKVLP